MGRLVCFFAFALAAGAAWEPLGPFGGAAEIIVVNPADPNELVTATKSGLLYRSTDKGASWSAVNFHRSFSVSVHALTVSSDSVPIFYLGVTDRSSEESGMYRSSDGAATWEPVRSMRGRIVYSISVWKRNPRVVAAGCADGVFLSRNGGDSWKRISRVAFQPVTAIALDPQQDDTIYAGTPHLPWKTVDGGFIWTSIHRGMLDDSDVFSLEIDHADPRRIFASACSGVYMSDNGGELWSKLSGIPHTSRRTYVIRQDPFKRRTLYAGTSGGLWKSADLGATWSRISNARVRSIAFDPAGAATLYLATEDAGLLVSHDRGATTQPISAGFVNRNLWSISAGARSIYITDGRSLTMRAAGRDWAAVGSPTGQSSGNLIGVAEIGGNTLLAYTLTEMFRSSTAGRTWSKLRPIAADLQLRFLKPVAGEQSLLAGTSRGLYRSDDLGNTWAKVIPDSSPVNAAYGGAASNGAVLVSSDAGLLLSPDAGRNWTPILSPFGESELYDLDVNSDGVLLAATARGLFRSTDLGKKWGRLDGRLGSGTVHHVLFHPRRLLAFAVQDNAVHVSGDSGLTWTPLDTQPGFESINIRSLALSPDVPDQLFVLTQARGVFVSDLSATLSIHSEAASLK